MRKIGVIVNTEKPRAAAVLRRLQEMAHSAGVEVRASADSAALVPGIPAVADDKGFANVEAVMALGGDGTMLAAVRRLRGMNKPLIGVNIGSLGFMTSVAEADMEAALLCLRDDQYRVSERTIAACEVLRDGKSVLGLHEALNDVVVRNGATSRVVRLEVSIDGSLVTTYVCDGVIVSTPTGSTGYSLSADGPIVTPETEAFVISVICPHTLSSRPLVIPDRSRIRIAICGQAQGLLLSIDGQDEHELGGGDVVEICRAAHSVRFLHLPSHDYFAVLRQKLSWSGSAVTGSV